MSRPSRRNALHLFPRLFAGLGFAWLASARTTGAGGVVGCSGTKPRADHDVLRSPDERTAVAWIAKAFRKEGFKVESGRKIAIGGGHSVLADVSAVDAPWSVLWLREDEVQELKGKLPAPPPGVASGALWVHAGVGDDDDQRMLILLEKAYEYDPDPRGDKGVVRSIQEVEARTIRDVTDFLVRAKAGEL